MRARIFRSSTREFDCALENGDIVPAKALGNLLKHQENLVIGDFVTLEKEEATGEYTIVKREDRMNEVFRILVRESKKKVTAANVDVLVIVMSVSIPQFKRGVLDRFLVRASQWEIPAFVVFNKMDEFDGQIDLNFEKERLDNLSAECFEISALDSNYEKKFLDQGLAELKEKLKAKTALFVGHSGVGKSETISELAGAEVELRTKKVGKGGKGSHTTTWSEIVNVGPFYLMDSPGIRSFSVDDIDPEELIIYFPDLRDLAGHCKFYDCQHLESSKGCAFWENHDKNTVKGQQVLSRLESYQRMREEVSQIPFWQKKL